MEKIFVTKEDCEILLQVLRKIPGNGPNSICKDCKDWMPGCNCKKLNDAVHEFEPIVENGLETVFEMLNDIRQYHHQIDKLVDGIDELHRKETKKTAELIDVIEYEKDCSVNPVFKLIWEMEL